MNFTYEEYRKILILLKENNYTDIFYDEDKLGRKVILRHDIDYSLDKALKIAILENELGFKSTYFILLTSDFYNVYSKKSVRIIRNIMNLNHRIGLHYDETKYDIVDDEGLITTITKEAKLFSEMLELEINVMSMHRPSKKLLEKNLNINNVINSYSKKYFEDMKYISDSRMYWREDPFAIINSNEYEKLHILTHPFWYSDKVESRKEKILKFIEQAKVDRHLILEKNITNLDEILEVK